MRIFLRYIGRFDWVLVSVSIGLTLFGAFSLYSSSQARGDFSNFEKQIVFLLFGILLMFFISTIDYRLIRNNSYFILLLYGIGIVALAGLLLFAPEIRGIKGWYRIGSISVDPIEFIKLILLTMMAKYFSSRHIEVYRIRHIFFTGIYFLIPIVLIALQPDLGPVLILLLLWSSLLLVAGIRFRHLFGLATVGTVVFAIGWSFLLLEHQKNRILSFVAPELDPLGIGWSQLQAKIAIGNGGIFGQGFASGTQTQYGFLSEPQTDFIFAAIAEEFGLFGISLLFLLLGIFIWRILKIGVSKNDNFSRLYAAGFAAILISQIFINVGMNLGLLPIIGLSLPLVSYGGSSLILSYIGLGVLLSIKSH
jgi:rod shape determining protein RodA